MRPLLPSFLLAIFLSLGRLPAALNPTAALAAGTAEGVETTLDQQQKEQRLNQGIRNQKSNIAETMQKEIELLARLEQLEGQVAAERRRLLELQRHIAEQESQFADQQGIMDQLLVEHRGMQQQVQERLAAYYRMGEIGLLNVLFSTASLPELLDLEEYSKRMLHQDRLMIISFRKKIEEVNEAGRRLTEDRMRLSALQSEIEEQEKRAAGSRQEANEFLKRVRTEKKLNQRAVQEMERAARHLASTLEKPREENPAGSEPQPEIKRATEEPTSFAARKGSLTPPAAGALIIRFGEEITGKFGLLGKSTGIGIRTGPGAQIRAIHEGRVIYAGPLRGYGNLLIIDHGQQYYSLTSQADRFFPEKDALVQAGQVVGVMGDQYALPENGLHFEIRQGATPQDPLPWLNSAGLLDSGGQGEKIRPDFSSFGPLQKQRTTPAGP